MIKVNCGHIEVFGPNIIIEAELATLFHKIGIDGNITKERLHEIVEDGFLTEEELDKRIAKQQEENGITDEQADEEMKMISAVVDLISLLHE